jgi:hypothetical protein
MNESVKRFLTEKVLGECWHEWKHIIPEDRDGYYDYDYTICTKCKEKWSGINHAVQRTFATDADVMDLMRAMVKQGKWVRFYLTAIDSYYHSSAYKGNRWGMTADKIDWLFLSTEPDGVRTFARLAGEFYKEDGK